MGLFSFLRKKSQVDEPMEVSQPVEIKTSSDMVHFSRSIMPSIKNAASTKLLSSTKDFKRILYSQAQEPVYFTIEEVPDETRLYLVCKGKIPKCIQSFPDLGGNKKLATLVLKPEGDRIITAFVPEFSAGTQFSPKPFTYNRKNDIAIKADIINQFNSWLQEYFTKDMVSKASLG